MAVTNVRPGGSIVVVTLSYFPRIGGAERQVQMLAERWAAAGERVVVLTRRVPASPARETIGGAAVVRLRSTWRPGLSWITFGFGAFAFIARRRREVGCLVVQMLNVAALPAALAASLFGIPLVIKPSAGGAGGNLERLRRSRWGAAKTSLLLGAASAVVAINREVADELRAAGLPAAKLKRIPNGVDTERFRPADPPHRAELRGRLGIGPDEAAVLFVGRTEKVKNLDVLLAAWPSVVRRSPSARLLVAGDGAERAALQERAAAMATVRFLGARDDAAELYAAADLFVLPSHREGVSNALLEAMATGLPVVVSRAGGNPTVVGEGRAGVLLEADDAGAWAEAIASLLADPDRRRRLGEAARRRVTERFSIVSVSERYRALCANLRKPTFGRPFPILAYHRVLPTPAYGMDVASDVFERQMRWLRDSGYRSISLEEVWASWSDGRPFPERSVCITFDDGHREMLEHAAPILQLHGFTATVFLNTGLLGRRFWVGGRSPEPVRWYDEEPSGFDPRSPRWRVYRFMSWEDALALSKRGFELASHGVTHAFLTRLSDDELEREVRESKRALEAKAGRALFFCYPSGDFDERVRAAVARAGYVGAVVSPGHYDLLHSWEDPYAFERIGMSGDVAFWKFEALVRGWYPKLRRAMPRWLWNAARSRYRSVTRSAPLAQT